MEAYITAVRPKDVADEVQRWRSKGCRRFVLREVARGGMLDLERLGAARYAAGLQAEVTLGAEALASVPVPLRR
jgi:L-alanine-DL-glutamate epimerase-like enolase superfamily enzyme